MEGSDSEPSVAAHQERAAEALSVTLCDCDDSAFSEMNKHLSAHCMGNARIGKPTSACAVETKCMRSAMVAVQARNVARPSDELTLRCMEAAAKRILLEAMIGDLCMEAPADSLSARGGQTKVRRDARFSSCAPRV